MQGVPTDEDAFPKETRPRSGMASSAQAPAGGLGWYAYRPSEQGDASSAEPAAISPDIGSGVVAPPPAEGEVDVWLTGWQVEDDCLQVTLGETVVWELVPMDQDWITRLFDGRRVVSLQLDTCAGALSEPATFEWTEIRGVVQRIDQVSVLYVASNDPLERGLVPKRGAAVVHTVPSIWPEDPHSGSINGWIVRVLKVCEHLESTTLPPAL